MKSLGVCVVFFSGSDTEAEQTGSAAIFLVSSSAWAAQDRHAPVLKTPWAGELLQREFCYDSRHMPDFCDVSADNEWLSDFKNLGLCFLLEKL